MATQSFDPDNVGYLSTRQLARLLHVQPQQLRAAARQLGFVAGVHVTSEKGQPQITGLWPPAWTEELRGELERGVQVGINGHCDG